MVNILRSLMHDILFFATRPLVNILNPLFLGFEIRERNRNKFPSHLPIFWLNTVIITTARHLGHAPKLTKHPQEV